MDTTPPQPDVSDPPSEQLAEQVLDIQLETRVSDQLSPALFKQRTLDALPWFVVLVAVLLLVGVEASRQQAGISGLRYEIWGSIVFVLVTSAVIWAKLGALPGHTAKFVFTKPDDVISFVHFDEVGIHVGVPKLHRTHYAWIFFTLYRFQKNKKMVLLAPGLKLTINLEPASDEELAQLRAGLARVFARPRVGPPIRIRDCMGCGYDLSASPGPDCPECGRPLHKLNYLGTRTTDLTSPSTDGK